MRIFLKFILRISLLKNVLPPWVYYKTWQTSEQMIIPATLISLMDKSFHWQCEVEADWVERDINTEVEIGLKGFTKLIKSLLDLLMLFGTSLFFCWCNRAQIALSLYPIKANKPQYKRCGVTPHFPKTKKKLPKILLRRRVQ